MLGGRCLMLSEKDKKQEQDLQELLAKLPDLVFIEIVKNFISKNYKFFIGYILATIIMIFVLR